jgi:hypothetical protein
MAEVSYIGKFVNVYLEDRAYGGPEEGGWWYDVGKAVRSTQVAFDLGALSAEEQAWCDEENLHRRSDVGSVLSEGRYAVRVEDGPAADFPAERPHYE